MMIVPEYRQTRTPIIFGRFFAMRKYMWMAFLVLAFVAVAGIVHARGGLIPSHGPVDTGASASASESPTCPLQWLKSFCCSGD